MELQPSRPTPRGPRPSLGFWGLRRRWQLHRALDPLRNDPDGVVRAHLERLAEIWGDAPNVADTGFLWEVWRRAREGGKVLECGSGLTSVIVLAAGATLVALEHDPDRQAFLCAQLRELDLDPRGVRLAPLAEVRESRRWYRPSAPLRPSFSLVVVDGPPAHLADRSLVFEVARNAIAGATILERDGRRGPWTFRPDDA